MAHAKSLLKDYSTDDIMGCLKAIRDGLIEPPIPLQTLAALRKFEPPLINRWLDYKKTPPPVYLTAQYKAWLAITGGDKASEISQEIIEQPLLIPPTI